MFEQPPSFPRFSGGFVRWSVVTFIDRDKSTSSVLLVFSKGKRTAVKRYLWLKFLWNSLTRLEFKLFLMTLDNSDEDKRKWAFLKALTSNSHKLLRGRLLKAELFLGLKESTRESYLGTKRMRIEIYEIDRRLKKTRKYTGYIKSPSSAGRKSRRSIDSCLSEATQTDFFYEIEEFSWDDILSVGSINFFSGRVEVLFDPDDR
jgi:hypothetical protein